MPRPLVTPSQPRSALVTGAARGIGRAVAAELVTRGYQVVVTDVDAADAARTAAEIGAVEGFALDVTDEQANRAAAARTAAIAPLGAWVCNAGVLFEGDLVDLTSDQIRLQFDVNVLGVAWGVRAAAEVFRQQAASGVTGGEIGILASLSAHAPVPGLSAYAATKAAVLSLATSLATELLPDGIGVHAVCPDGVATAMVDGMVPGGGARQALAGGVMLTPEKVATSLVDMFGTKRVYRTLPAWRGVLGRLMSTMPGPARPLDRLSRRIGAHRLRRAERRGH
ncbi:oxidoreductase, short chain dehydrogenase/reductase family protein [Aeromicrobium marinum DSM 15272]|uniref:Oxidoreductase, short chain dehydrogenase/reductase family protein n=1 Tax=Aeromicrobium marinum DSM 15272 TaxID=585531 RepID=E2S919_9ACTN|nr:SDR family oxidoreductase [Aeromicrobium marinum]EFQ84289.1 oxidoreductase, short chain dehydrogenase/reductase family protein [Aeromicrobium marinum DSM 15272]